MKRKKINSNTKWESIVGYSRAVRTGNLVYVSGTTAVNETGSVVGRNDAYAQTKFILAKIEKALKTAGSGLQDVVRTRMYVIDISQWSLVGKAHGEVFENIKPASTMVEVKGLVNKELLVEIEADAVIE